MSKTEAHMQIAAGKFQQACKTVALPTIPQKLASYREVVRSVMLMPS
jgi:hypothetical protein